MTCDILIKLLVISAIEGIFLLMIDVVDLSFFNPLRNYEEWYGLNWFGVIFFTIILNVTLPLYAFLYWFYKLCTVGRE